MGSPMTEDKKSEMLAEIKSETVIKTSESPVSQASPERKLPLTEATNLPHNPIQDEHKVEPKPPLPTFGWESLHSVQDPVPYVVRDSISYVAWIIYENKVLKRFVPVLSESILSFVTTDLEHMSENEAAMYNDINMKHCDGNLVGSNYRFRSGESMISIEDVKKSFNFFLTCYNVVCLNIFHNDLFGFLNIAGENNVAFVWSNNMKLVPLFYFEGQSEYLDSRSIDLTDKWQLRYMEFCCIAQGIRRSHLEQSPLKVVDFEYVRGLFPKSTPIKCSWSNNFNENVLTPQSRHAMLHGFIPNILPNQPANLLAISPKVTNSAQYHLNSITPRSDGSNQSVISRPETRLDQTTNPTQSNLNSMMQGQTVNTEKRLPRPEIRSKQTANSDPFHTYSTTGDNTQSGMKRSVSSNGEIIKRLRCQKNPPPRVTQTGNQANQTASSLNNASTVHQPPTSVLHKTAGVIVPVMSEEQHTGQSTSTTQKKPSALVPISVQTESCVASQKENVSSITSTFNQTVITSAARGGVAVHPPNGPLNNFTPSANSSVPFNRGMPPALHSSEYRFPSSGWNGTVSSVRPANMLQSSPLFYQRQPSSTFNPMLMRSSSYYGNPIQSMNTTYLRLVQYFHQNVKRGSSVNVNALAEIFMNTSGISASDRTRLGPWIFKTFAEFCRNAGCILVMPPPVWNVQNQTHFQVPTDPNDSVELVECAHVRNHGNYDIKELQVESLKIYGISLTTVKEEYLVNYEDLERKFEKNYENFHFRLSQIKFKTLYQLNKVQKLEWDKLVKAGLVSLGPNDQVFIRFSAVLDVLRKF